MAKKGKQELKVVSGEPVDLDDNATSDTPQAPSSDTKETKEAVETEKTEDKEAPSTKDDIAVADETVKVSDKSAKESQLEEKDAEAKQETEKEKKEDTGTTSKEEDAPPPPPRPVSPVTQITKDLKDAFPNIEDKYITAVLVASEGKLDPAFNALLYISDPSFKPEIPVPTTSSAPPPPPKGLTDDEKLARQLQKEFEKEDRRQRAARSARKHGRAPPARQQDEEESPDEFEQIKETFTQGFEEARTTLNGWVSGITRKFQEPNEQGNSKQSPKLFGALGGSSFNSSERKSGFDKDPEIISNDFHTKISMKDQEEEAPQLPKRQENKWRPLNPEVPVNSDAFLVTDSEDEEEGRKK